jgi:hypothetical protein
MQAVIVACPAIKLTGTSFSFSGDDKHIIIPATKRITEICQYKYTSFLQKQSFLSKIHSKKTSN